MLRFRLLGPFEAYREDLRIPATAFRSVQARCALKLLISEHDRPVAFTRLMDTFWGDADPAAARNSMQAAVRTLRRVLEPDLTRGEDSRFIVTSGQAYRFVPNGSIIDVDAFLGHRQAGLDAERRGNARGAIDAFRSAMAAYTGEYIGEEPDADWVLGTRERLRDAFVDTAERLAALLDADGLSGEAVAAIERALVADPLREELYLRLVRCHARAGRRGHAIAAFERCRRVLAAQLGTVPGPDLVRLRDDLLARPVPIAAEQDPTPLLAAPFVGRETELAALRAAWSRSAAGPLRMVAVTGEAGIGKTRLVQHFAERLGPDAATVWLHARQSAGDLGLAPLLVSFGNWLDSGATTRQVERLGAHGPALAQVLPQVRALWPDCAPMVAPIERAAVYEAFGAAVVARAGRARPLVVLDDAQWSDAETLSWLSYTVERLPAGALVVTITRPGEGRSVEVERLHADARRSGWIVDLMVGPLGVVDVAHLIDDAMAGRAQGTALAQRIHRATRGNALFVVETLRDLRGGASDDIRVAESIREAILSRIVALPSSARRVLGQLAATSTPADARMLSAATATPLEHIVDAVDVLLSRRLAAVVDGGYAIEHPFIGAVVQSEFSAVIDPRAREGAAAGS